MDDSAAHNESQTDTAPARAARPVRGPVKVGVVWLVTLVLFAAFNALWWPAQVRRHAQAPEFFEVQAERLWAMGEQDVAVRKMARGLQLFRPVDAGLYRRHADMAAVRPNKGDLSRRAGMLANFYEGLALTDTAREQRWQSLAQDAAADWPDASLGPDMVKALAGAMDSFSRAYGAAALKKWPVKDQLGLLYAANGALRFGGVIGRTGVKTPVSLLVYSGGGDASGGPRRGAHLFVGGADHAGTGGGLHAALVNPETGAVTAADSFDFRASEEAADRLVAWLGHAPAGAIGLFAVRDDAARNFTEAAEAALGGFGLAREAMVLDRPSLFGTRYSFAAIGVKGAPADSGLQAWSPGQWRGRPGHPVTCVVLPREAAP